MLSAVKLWLRIILGFIFSVCTIIGIFAYGLLGTVATDSMEIILTEATGLQNQEVILSAKLQPLVIQNTFLFAIAAMVFCLIFLYFLEHKFSVYFAPGVLCLISIIFVQGALWVGGSYIPTGLDGETAAYINEMIKRISYACLFGILFGAVLIVISYLAHRRGRQAQTSTLDMLK